MNLECGWQVALIIIKLLQTLSHMMTRIAYVMIFSYRDRLHLIILQCASVQVLQGKQCP